MNKVKLVGNSNKTAFERDQAVGSAALWRRISFDIEQMIKSRVLAPGDKLPTEHRLVMQYMATRHTVRRALAHLADRGLVETTQGRGSFVRRPALIYKIGRRTRWSEMMAHLRASAQTRTLSLEVRPAGLREARALGFAVAAPVVAIERLALVDDEPVSLSRHHFSQARFPFFLEMYAKTMSITQTLLESGVPDYTRSRTRVTARLPTPEECELLNLPRHVPLLVTQSLNLDGMKAPLEWGEARFAADRIELDLEADAAEAAED
jgi:phosphonate metabolism transcriptional regulator PhnF